MKTIINHIAAKQSQFRHHEFFQLIKNIKSIEDVYCFLPQLAFWAMAFQDVLRINETKIKDPYLLKIARHHRQEDSGHDRWFLEDINYLSSLKNKDVFHQYNIAWLFDKNHTSTRDASYEIMAFLESIQNDHLRIVALLTLESTGHVFFEEMSSNLIKIGEDKKLKYFSSFHLEIEKAHELFEQEMERKLLETRLDESTRRDALNLVDKFYRAFEFMFDGLVNDIVHYNEQVASGQANATVRVA